MCGLHCGWHWRDWSTESSWWHHCNFALSFNFILSLVHQWFSSLFIVIDSFTLPPTTSLQTRELSSAAFSSHTGRFDVALWLRSLQSLPLTDEARSVHFNLISCHLCHDLPLKSTWSKDQTLDLSSFHQSHCHSTGTQQHQNMQSHGLSCLQGSCSATCVWSNDSTL